MKDYILKADHLKKCFYSRERSGRRMKQPFAAVEDVSFRIERGECLGLVGESGSGKTTTAYMTAGLLKPDAGKIDFTGETMQMIFQDPMKAVNPRKKVLETICEGLVYRRNGMSRKQIEKKALEAMDLVQLNRDCAGRYSRELSGGECQRVTIARAILIQPELLICDEVTSALDVSVQAQIMTLLCRLKKQMHLSCLFISHDIALVSSFCDRTAVMQQGKIVEQGRTRDVLRNPAREYTRRLIDSVLTLPEPESEN